MQTTPIDRKQRSRHRTTGHCLQTIQAKTSETQNISMEKSRYLQIKEDLESFGNTFRNIGKRDIESLWHALKDAMQNTIDKKVPSKMTQGRHTHP